MGLSEYTYNTCISLKWTFAVAVGTILKATKLDTLPLNRMTSDVKQYSECVEEERNALCAAALQNERVKSGNNGIDIVTDARHSTRRNSKYTDVVYIGYSSHQVIEHVGFFLRMAMTLIRLDGRQG